MVCGLVDELDARDYTSYITLHRDDVYHIPVVGELRFVGSPLGLIRGPSLVLKARCLCFGFEVRGIQVLLYTIAPTSCFWGMGSDWVGEVERRGESGSEG